MDDPNDGKRWTKASTALLPYASAERSKPGLEPLPIDLLARVLALRPRPEEGYDERLYADSRCAWFRLWAARAVLCSQRRPSALVGPFLATLEEPVWAGCAPECCSASTVRDEQLEARLEILRVLRRIVPTGELHLRSDTLEVLLQATPRLVALLTTDLIGRNAVEANRFRAALIGALDHPYPRVAESAAVGLRRGGVAVASDAARPLFRMLKHSDDRVRGTAAAALQACGRVEMARERLEKLADRDSSPFVRFAAKRALGRPTHEPSRAR